LESKGYEIKNSILISLTNLVAHYMQLIYQNIPAQGGLYCFWCPNKTSSPLLSTSNMLKNVKNILQMRKLWPPKVKGVNNSKKKPLKTTKADF
jgi:hypothetical protein